jgi:hypothetical protein
MSKIPFTLPSCEHPATVRIEVYSAVDGRLHGSLDASVYACEQHGIETVSAIQAARLTAHRVPMAPDVARTCGHVHTFRTGNLDGSSHPRWCDQKDCDRRRAHCSSVLQIDTNQAEESVLDVALRQDLEPGSKPVISLTVIDGVRADHVVMSLGQARALSYRVRQLLDSSKGGTR